MDNDQLITSDKFCNYYNVPYSFVASLEEVGLIETVFVQEVQFVQVSHLSRIERIIRLHDDLNINLEGIEAIDRLLDKMDQMNSEIASLRNQLRFYEK